MIFHLCTPTAWEKAQESGIYLHQSLEKEGFIHFSTKEQLPKTAELYFRNEDVLILLSLEEQDIEDMTKWETSRNDQLFPHVYGEIPITFFKGSSVIRRDESGKWPL